MKIRPILALITLMLGLPCAPTSEKDLAQEAYRQGYVIAKFFDSALCEESPYLFERDEAQRSKKSNLERIFNKRGKSLTIFEIIEILKDITYIKDIDYLSGKIIKAFLLSWGVGYATRFISYQLLNENAYFAPPEEVFKSQIPPQMYSQKDADLITAERHNQFARKVANKLPNRDELTAKASLYIKSQKSSKEPDENVQNNILSKGQGLLSKLERYHKQLETKVLPLKGITPEPEETDQEKINTYLAFRYLYRQEANQKNYFRSIDRWLPMFTRITYLLWQINAAHKKSVVPRKILDNIIAKLPPELIPHFSRAHMKLQLTRSLIAPLWKEAGKNEKETVALIKARAEKLHDIEQDLRENRISRIDALVKVYSSVICRKSKSTFEVISKTFERNNQKNILRSLILTASLWSMIAGTYAFTSPTPHDMPLGDYAITTSVLLFSFFKLSNIATTLKKHIPHKAKSAYVEFFEMINIPKRDRSAFFHSWYLPLWKAYNGDNELIYHHLDEQSKQLVIQAHQLR